MRKRALIFATTAAAAAAGFLGTGPTVASGATCYAQANAPYYDNGTIKAWGYVECGGGGDINAWSAYGSIMRDGEKTDTDGCKRWGDGRCHVTPATPNRAGDQKWCHWVRGGAVYSREETCEYSGF